MICSCGKTFTCDPNGDCWCKGLPILNIPDDMKSDKCLCPDCIKALSDKLKTSKKPPFERQKNKKDK